MFDLTGRVVSATGATPETGRTIAPAPANRGAWATGGHVAHAQAAENLVQRTAVFWVSNDDPGPRVEPAEGPGPHGRDRTLVTR